MDWILFVFHRNVEEARGWKPKVLPPRSATKQGVFATRSPHRPNAIGMTSARLERIDGLAVHVRGLDVLDGTPVLDLKPYVAYADAHLDARAGWLEAPDPLEAWRVAFDAGASSQLAMAAPTRGRPRAVARRRRWRSDRSPTRTAASAPRRAIPRG